MFFLQHANFIIRLKQILNYTQSSDFHELVLYQISSARSARKFSSQMSVPNAWTRCHSPVITNMVATSQMEQSLNCRSWNKMLSNIYLCWYWNCILGPITIETRPIKQCKSLIWILIFVLFWYIRWRKAKTATKTIPPDDHLQKAGASGWSFANGQPLRMIICKRPVPSDDHLQGACPFGWSFQEAGPSRWSYARGRPLRFIICRRLVPLDDTLILFKS